jgi:hypothetical protein
VPIVLAAAFPELFPAIALLLLVFAALIVVRKPLVALLSMIPAIGGTVADAVSNGLQAVIDWALYWAHQGLDPLVQLVWTPIQAVIGWAAGVVSALEALASFVSMIPSDVASVAAWAGSRITALVSSLASLASRVTAVAASIPTIARTVAAKLVGSLNTELRAVISSVRAALAAAVSAVALQAAQEVAALRAWAVVQVLGLSTALSAAVATLGHVTGVELPDIRGQLARLAEGLGLLTAANLIGRLLTLERTVATTIEECVTPTCNVIGPQLGVLQALMDIGLLLAVGELVGEAVRDPEGAAKATAGAISGVAGAASGLVQEFAGIQV